MIKRDSVKSKKIGLIIGQAPPEKNYPIPFSKTRLYKWLLTIGLTQNDVIHLFEFEALVPNFPGKGTKGHNCPVKKDIVNHIPTLLNKIDALEIQFIIPVGKMAIQYLLEIDNVNLSLVVGKKFVASPFGVSEQIIDIIPLPHPSGLSTWVFHEQNQRLLNRALRLIKESAAKNHN